MKSSRDKSKRRLTPHVVKLLSVYFCSITPFHAAAADPVFSVEAEIARGADVSKISLFVVNRLSEDLHLGAPKDGYGRRPGFSPVEEGKGGGASGLPPPRIMFSFGEGRLIEIEASGQVEVRPKEEWTQDFIVGPGQRKLYYSFFVASSYVRGDFLGGTVEVYWKGVRLPLLIVRIFEAGPMNASVLGDAANPETSIHVDLNWPPKESKFQPKVFGEMLLRRGEFFSDLEIWLVSKSGDDTDFASPFSQSPMPLPNNPPAWRAFILFDSSFGYFALSVPAVRRALSEGEDPVPRIHLPAGQRHLVHRFKLPTVYLAGGKGFSGGAIETDKGLIPIRLAKLISAGNVSPQKD